MILCVVVNVAVKPGIIGEFVPTGVPGPESCVNVSPLLSVTVTVSGKQPLLVTMSVNITLAPTATLVTLLDTF